jgi:hypothetical protein
MEKQIKEMPQPEPKESAKEVQRPFKLKPEARIEITAEEIGFLINLGAAFAPFMGFSQAIQQSVAFAEYLKDTVVKTQQVQFMDNNSPESIFTPVSPDSNSEEKEEEAAKQLDSMRVVHSVHTSEVQEELANS